MTSAHESAEFADLVAAQDRRLEREGIPMYLALVSETAYAVPAPGPSHVADGQRLAGAMDRYRAAMAPNQRDDDHGVYISVMQAVSYCDFDASRLGSDQAAAAAASSAGGQGDPGAPAEDPIRPHGPRDAEAAL